MTRQIARPSKDLTGQNLFSTGQFDRRYREIIRSPDVTVQKDWVISGKLVILFSYQFFFYLFNFLALMLLILSVKYQDHLGISRLHSVNNRKTTKSI